MGLHPPLELRRFDHAVVLDEDHLVSVETDFDLIVNHLLIRRLSASLPQAILLLLLHALPVLPLATLQIAVLGSQQARERGGVGLWTFTRDVRLVCRAHPE